MREMDFEMMRERERERESKEQSTILVAIMSRAAEENRATTTTKLRRVKSLMPLKITHSNCISLGAFFIWKRNIWIIFMIWVEHVTNLKALGFFFLKNILLVC